MSTRRPLKVRFVLQQEPLPYGHKPCLSDPESIFDFYQNTIRKDPTFEDSKENVLVIALDARLCLIGYNIVSTGTISETSAHPREVFRPILALNGGAFIMLHNHPSGDPSPSRADELVTRRMVECAALLQIRFLDHMVCGSPGPGRQPYFSFKEAGFIS